MTDVKLLDVFDDYLDIIDYLKENGWVYTLDVIITNSIVALNREVFDIVVRYPSSLTLHFHITTTDGERYSIARFDGFPELILNGSDEVIEWLDKLILNDSDEVIERLDRKKTEKKEDIETKMLSTLTAEEFKKLVMDSKKRKGLQLGMFT